ncbi:MAG: hypothetical protein PHX60_02155 [Giesbergeria sp.]|uniref:hypothetical protein n=1 Tax=Giesbergeria sp. TaxID=2818473 RepID=UPI0026225CEC|nr:hypothetical protein [Giesbergeria sp.]MDD2608483.1 hypothetical protein [Giesbergeria sp.]
MKKIIYLCRSCKGDNLPESVTKKGSSSFCVGLDNIKDSGVPAGLPEPLPDCLAMGTRQVSGLAGQLKVDTSAYRVQ